MDFLLLSLRPVFHRLKQKTTTCKVEGQSRAITLDELPRTSLKDIPYPELNVLLDKTHYLEGELMTSLLVPVGEFFLAAVEIGHVKFPNAPLVEQVAPSDFELRFRRLRD